MQTEEKPKLDKTDEEARIADDQWGRYVRARDNGHTAYIARAQKCDRYYVGDQWDASDVAKLEAEKRPHLTINMILSVVNTLLGEQTSNRTEFKYKPRNGGTEDTASVITKVAAVIRDANNYDWVESAVFADGVIQERGFFDIRVNFDENMMGHVVIRADDPTNIILDPDAKEYDPTTWKEVYETGWMSIDEIEAMFGQEKADRLRHIAESGLRYDPDSITFVDEAKFGDADNKQEIPNTAISEDEKRSIKLVRVIDRQYVRFSQVKRFVDPQYGDTKVVPETWDEAQIAEFAQRMGLLVVPTYEKKIRWTTTADRVVLHDSWSPYRTFTKIPYFCYFRRGRPFGLVSNLISPQEQLNKLSSQELHIINTTANSGWLVERGSLSGMTADDLRNQGAETGIVLEYNQGRTPPEKIKPNTIPTGIDRVSMKSASFIREISGVNEAMLGQEASEVSGVALENKQMRGLTQMQVPFDNLKRTQFFVGRKILELVQQFYTEERVFRIATEGLDFENEDDKQFIINQQVGAGEVVNDITVGTYEVVLSTVPARDSFADSQFAEAVNLVELGIPIPPDRVIEYSHLARKAELAEEVRQATGRGKMTEEQMARQQFEQEMNDRMMMAEVMRAEAEVTKLEAEAMRLAAEASLKEGGMNSPEIRIKLEDLEVRQQIARDQLQLRLGLAKMAAVNRLDTQNMSIKGKLVTDAANNRAKLQQEKVKAVTAVAKEKAKPKPKPTSGRSAKK